MGVDKAFFVTGDKVVVYGIDTDAATGEQWTLGEAWSNLSGEFATGLDAAVDLGFENLYVFRGGEYVRIPFATQAVDDGYPLPIAGNWVGVSFDRIDAAMTWGDGKLYLFSGTQYVRYDIAADQQDPHYPKPIAGNWVGVTDSWVGDGIDAAINPGNGRAYLFKGHEYVALDWHTKSQLPGYPLPIAEQWPGLDGPFDAAWTNLAGPPPPPEHGAVSGDEHGGYVRIPGELRVGGTLAWRNHNPGNLLPGRVPYKTALAVDRRGLAIFPSYDHGWTALREVLRSRTYGPLSVADAMKKYAPSGHGGNDPVVYAAHIRRITGIEPDRVVDTLDEGELERFMTAIKQVEGFREGTVHTADSTDIPAELEPLRP